MCGGIPGAWFLKRLFMSTKGLIFGMFLLTLVKVALCCFLELLLLLLLVRVEVEVEVQDGAPEDGLLENDLAVIVTSGFEVNTPFWLEPASLDLDFAAAAKTSAMLLLKVSGIAEEPELSEFLNSWLLLDFEVPPEVVADCCCCSNVELLATSEVFPSVGPLACFCFNVGSLSNCIRF